MKIRTALLATTAMLVLSRYPAAQTQTTPQSAVESEDIDLQAEPAPEAKPAPAAPAKAAEQAPAPKPAAPAAAPAAQPRPAAQEDSTLADDDTTVTESTPPAAAPPTPPATPARSAPPAAAAAPQNAPNCATQTRAIGALYDELASEAKDFSRSSEDEVAALKRKEADIQVRLDAANQEYAEKSKDPAVIKKTSWWGGNKELHELKAACKQITKELSAAHDDTLRRSEAVITETDAMKKRHLAAIKAKYAAVEKLVEADKDK